MLRRIFAALAVCGVLLSATGRTLPVPPEQSAQFLAVFFAIFLCIQVWPLLMTQRGHWGHRKHPVNKMYTFFAGLGIIGSLGVVFVVFIHGDLELLLILAGPTMFLGIMGAAVLAFFATPWRDWSFCDPQLRRGKAQRSRLGLADAEDVERGSSLED